MNKVKLCLIAASFMLSSTLFVSCGKDDPKQSQPAAEKKQSEQVSTKKEEKQALPSLAAAPEAKKEEEKKADLPELPANETKESNVSELASNDNKDLESMKTGDLWVAYKEARNQAKADEKSEDYAAAAKNYLRSGAASKQLERPDISAWQFNNAAKNNIDEFRKVTDYKSRMSKLEGMKASKEKKAYHQECIEKFKANLAVLEKAESYLKTARSEHAKDEKAPENRLSVIERNENFIKHIKDWTSK